MPAVTDLRLVPAAGVAWAAAALCFVVPGATPVVAVLCAAGALLLLRPALRRRAGLAVCVLALAVGAAGAASGGMRGAEGRGVLPEDRGSAVSGEGVVVSAVRGLGEGERVQLRVRAELRAQTGERFAATVDVVAPRLSGAEAAVPRWGSAVRFEGRWQPVPPGRAVPGRVVAAEPVREAAAPPGPVAWLGDLRVDFAAAAATLPGDGGQLLPGLVVGDDSGVDAGLRDAMVRSSLSHLTAVSGANCAIVVAAVFGVLALLRADRRVRILGALIALVAFVVLVTPEASVVRAAVMATAVLAGLARGRPRGGLPVLAAAVIVCVLADPALAVHIGFALSVTATAALLVLAAPLARALQRWLPRRLAMALSIPLAAQLACQPILLLLEPEVPLLGVLANFLAEPAAALTTVAGLAALVIGAAVPPLFPLVLVPLWPGAAWIAGLSRTVSAREDWILPTPPAPLGALVGIVLCGALLAGILLLGRPPREGPVHRAGSPEAHALRRHGFVVRSAPRAGSARARSRAIGALLLCLPLVIVAGGLGRSVVGGALVRAEIPSNWAIAACDVGQGDAVLVRSGTQTALVDAGPDPNALRRCLDLFHLDRIDLFVVSHFDADHVAGYPALRGIVDEIRHPPPATAAERRLVERWVRDGAVATETTAGQRGQFGDAGWRVHWPPAGSARWSGNAGSLVWRVRTTLGDALFLGDTDESAQFALRAHEPKLARAPIVKAAHHGSADILPELLRALRPHWAIVSVGADNRYGHPTRRALDAIRSAGGIALRTDTCGSLALAPSTSSATSSPDIELWTEHPCARPGPPSSAAPAASAMPSAPAETPDGTRKTALVERRLRATRPRRRTGAPRDGWSHG